MNILQIFIIPYLNFLLAAGYNVQQTLEGLGIWTSERFIYDSEGIASSGWDPTAALGLPLLCVTIYAFTLILMMLEAGRRIKGKNGFFFVLFLICIPGIASLMGLKSLFNWMPAVYEVGSGYVGDPWGMVALAIMGLMSGWSLTIIATKKFQLNDNYRHTYDHIWYAMAVLTGILFVADVHSAAQRQKMEDFNRDSREASAYLLQQVRRFDVLCRRDAIAAPEACSWASKVQQVLVNYAYQDSPLYWRLGPLNSADIYMPHAEPDVLHIENIRKQLITFNSARCPVQRINDNVQILAPASGICESPPPKFCISFPEPLGTSKRSFDIIRTVGLANECIVPSLVRMKAMQENLARQLQSSSQNRHLRWMFYVFFSVLAGCKVGNATAKLIATSKKIHSPLNLENSNASMTNWRRVKVPQRYQKTLNSFPTVTVDMKSLSGSRSTKRHLRHSWRT